MTTRGGSEWRVLKALGRNGDSVKVFPDVSPSVTSNFATTSASLDYQIYFFSTGKFPATVYRIPTLNEVVDCRLAVSLDDGPAQVLSGVYAAKFKAWSTNVLEQIEKLTATIDVKTSGYHTLHLFKVDPSIIVDRVVVDTGGLQPSYLGPSRKLQALMITRDTYVARSLRPLSKSMRVASLNL